MNYLKASRTISITAYCLIILKGQIIGIPLVGWLLFTVFDLGSLDQLFAAFAIFGLVLVFRNWNKAQKKGGLFIDLVSFILLAIPIIGRLSAVSLHLFNYNAFIIPTVVFAMFYMISLALSYIQYLTLKKVSA